MAKLIAQDVSWIITTSITGHFSDTDDTITVTNGHRIMSVDFDTDGKLYFNGQYVDVGDDAMQYISTMDEIAETGSSEPYEDEAI
jgi:hypothetical protein